MSGIQLSKQGPDIFQAQKNGKPHFKYTVEAAITTPVEGHEVKLFQDLSMVILQNWRAFRLLLDSLCWQETFQMENSLLPFRYIQRQGSKFEDTQGNQRFLCADGNIIVSTWLVLTRDLSARIYSQNLVLISGQCLTNTPQTYFLFSP